MATNELELEDYSLDVAELEVGPSMDEDYNLDVAELEVGPSMDVSCTCTGACKTNRCICRRNGQGCTRGKCKCRPSRCSQLKEEVAVDIDALGRVHSSDSEPEDFCVCTDDCNSTLCYCLAIKQKPCETSCKCRPIDCCNKAPSIPIASTPSATPKTVQEEVKDFCATSTKEDIEEMLLSVAERCPQLWKSVRQSRGDPGASQSSARPSWCKCGKCREEEDPQDRICCKNHQKNHENPHFFQLCLDQQTLELSCSKVAGHFKWLVRHTK